METILKVFAFLLAVTFGVGPFVIAFLRERLWWNRRHWKRANGTIIGYETKSNEGLTYPAKVEYESTSGPQVFVSEYGTSFKPKLGRQVAIVVSPDGNDAEIYSISNRYLASLVFPTIGFLVLFLIVETIKTNW